MHPDAHQILALYKSFTYLLIYLLAYLLIVGVTMN